MKIIAHSREYASLILIAANLCIPPLGFSAEKPSQQSNYTTNEAERLACQRQLNIIYSAIQQYQKRNQRLPRWLSDLVPDYIKDANNLVCPFVQNTGQLKKWRQEFVGAVFLDPNPACTYAYEFCLSRIDYFAGWTFRDYKQRQSELIGLSVPIVRCFAHRPILNLGQDGTMYPSPTEWEDNFALSDKYEVVLHDVPLFTNRSPNPIVLKLIEPRASKADASMLDLSKLYNALLLHLSQLDPAGDLLRGYPEGVEKIDGIEFDIRGLVHLTAKDFPIPFPKNVEQIGINRKCTNIHFLHGVIFAAPEGAKVASYVIHQGGETSEAPILYGKDVRTRWFNHKEKSELQNPKVAWASPAERAGGADRALRLYRTTWKNPSPNVEVTSIDFVSHMTPSAPFLVAVTLE
jgi:hypothetical protein